MGAQRELQVVVEFREERIHLDTCWNQKFDESELQL